MKIIQKLSEMIDEEIDDANRYAECALKNKADYPKAAEVFHRLSEEEIGHANMLHDVAAAMISDYRKANGDPPAEMLAVYNYLHEKQIRKAAEVKALQGMYKQ